MANDIPPIPYDSIIGETVDDTMGGTDLLKRFYISPYARDLEMVQVMFQQTSGAGVYKVTGGPIRSEGDGMYLPSGGGVLYLRSLDEVRNFRLRPNDGATITFSATAFRFGNVQPDSPR